MSGLTKHVLTVSPGSILETQAQERQVTVSVDWPVEVCTHSCIQRSRVNEFLKPHGLANQVIGKRKDHRLSAIGASAVVVSGVGLSIGVNANLKE